ncbi:MAG: hypothetical protein ABSE45_00485 [Candidatus Acidiferrales bacterium]|jgi:hypothetical protein
MRNKCLAAGLCLAVVFATIVGAVFARPNIVRAQNPEQNAVGRNCDRACLYGVLDKYLHALAAKAPGEAPWAKVVKNTENNVELRVGDGLWGTITGVGNYNLRFADPESGQVGFFGLVTETRTTSTYALRLKVEDGKISEVETVLRRPEAGGPFPNPPKLVDKPVLNEMVPSEHRVPRARLVALVDGYFNTLQLNDGTLFTEFTDDCNRIENGLQTTHNPDLMKTIPVANLGCADQFKMGNYRYDTLLRARRYPLVDEERQLVLAGAFIDHSGALGTFKLTDGTVIDSPMRTPSTLCLMELFRIQDGKIRQIEAVFIGVPYGMPSPWVPEE